MTSRSSNYNPSNRYNPQDTQQWLGSQNAGPSRTSASSGGGILPYQAIGNPSIWRISTILNGDDDDKFKYTFTTLPSSSNSVIELKFAHGLSYTPTVVGSFTFPSDKKRRPLPWGNPGGWGSPDNLTMTVDSVDNSYIYVKIGVYDALGLSLLLANNVLTFKFICFQEAIA